MYVFTIIPVNETFISLIISIRLNPRDNILSSFRISLRSKKVLPFSIILFLFTNFALMMPIFVSLLSLQLKYRSTLLGFIHEIYYITDRFIISILIFYLHVCYFLNYVGDSLIWISASRDPRFHQ